MHWGVVVLSRTPLHVCGSRAGPPSEAPRGRADDRACQSGIDQIHGGADKEDKPEQEMPSPESSKPVSRWRGRHEECSQSGCECQRGAGGSQTITRDGGQNAREFSASEVLHVSETCEDELCGKCDDEDEDDELLCVVSRRAVGAPMPTADESDVQDMTDKLMLDITGCTTRRITNPPT